MLSLFDRLNPSHPVICPPIFCHCEYSRGLWVLRRLTSAKAGEDAITLFAMPAVRAVLHSAPIRSDRVCAGAQESRPVDMSVANVCPSLGKLLLLLLSKSVKSFRRPESVECGTTMDRDSIQILNPGVIRTNNTVYQVLINSIECIKSCVM